MSLRGGTTKQTRRMQRNATSLLRRTGLHSPTHNDMVEMRLLRSSQ